MVVEWECVWKIDGVDLHPSHPPPDHYFQGTSVSLHLQKMKLINELDRKYHFFYLFSENCNVVYYRLQHVMPALK